MFRIFICVACLAASPVVGQTARDDQPSTENWWDRVGSGFFSDDGLTALRSEPEIRAHWTALSADDQSAILERCEMLNTRGVAESTGSSVPSEQFGSNTDLGASQSADGGTIETLAGDDVQLPADDGAQLAGEASELSVETADQTTVTGAIDGSEVHTPGDNVQSYTGLAGGASAEDVHLRSVCSVVSSI